MNSPSSTITTARPGHPLPPPSLTSGAAPASEAFPRVAGRGLTLTILLVVFALNFMDRQILAVLAEPIRRDLALSDTQLGLLYGLAFAVFYSILGIPLGRLADRFDRARILTVSVALFSLMTALCGVAASYWQLLLARIGVGVGEAGTNPPSHSMIADLFPVDRRSTAMAVFALGPCLGVLLGFLVGGWLGQILGWRAAFLIAGIAGLVVAAAAHWLLRDPGRNDVQGGRPQPRALPGPRVVFRALWRHASTRHLFMGAALCSGAAYAATGWLPAFLVRAHGMSVSAAGTALALTIGIVGGAGTLLGGLLADRIGKRDATWRLRIVAIASLVAIPSWLALLFVAGPFATLALLVPCGALLAFYLGPTFAMVQSLVDPRMRAVAAALLLLVMNIIGLGLGPVLVGVLSDALQATYGTDSLRLALLVVPPAYLWAAWHYEAASRTISADLRSAAESTPEAQAA